LKSYNTYIDDVINDRIIVSQTVKNTINRHLLDLERAKHNDFEYYFDENQADRYINFISMFRLTDQKIEKDTMKKPFVKVQPFQAFFIASIAGWRRKDNKEIRRFTDIYFQIARKNGKSTLVAMMIVAHFLLDGVNLGQFFTAATSRAQAAEVYNMAKEIIIELRKDFPEDLMDRIGLFRDRVIDYNTKSFIEKVSREAKSLEGKGSYCSSIDEYHLHTSDEIVSSIRKGGIKHDSPIIYRLTTPGFNIGGPCHIHYEYCKKIISGTVENDNIFVMIFELDPDDDWHDKSLWIKANPNIGNSPKMDALIIEYNESIAKGGAAIVDFKTKILSLWVSSSTGWIEDAKYVACCSDWILSNFENNEVFCGLDMAYSDQGDISAFSMYIPIDESHGKMYIKYWIPYAKAIDNGSGYTNEIDYMKMAQDGWLTITEGENTDYDIILADIIDLSERFKIRSIFFDAWNISYFYEQMEKKGLPVAKFNQSTGYMSPPTKRIGEMIHTKEIDFGMNPITRWMFSNVDIKNVGSGLIKMIRINRQKKIDGPVASVMAYASYINHRLNHKPYNPQAYVL
jgi:phage terminase large subunit-like protein